MKQIVCADIQLDINNRLGDFAQTLNQIQEYAVKHKIKRIKILGDIFQRRHPYPKEMRVLDNWIMNLAKNKIQIDLLLGNHDMDKDISTLEYLETLKVKNVRVVEPPLIEGGIYYNHMVLKESKMGPLGYQIPTNILSYKDLINKYPKIKAFILGHIHKPQIINKKPLVMHVGSIDRVNFGERNEKKYFLVVGNKTIKPIELNIRPMKQYIVNIENYRALFKLSFKMKPALKIVVEGTKEDVRKIMEDDKFWRHVKENSHTLVVKRDLQASNTTRDTTISEGKSTAENYLEYCKLNKFDKETTKIGYNIIEEVLK